ncbi:hypothetical protein KJ855_01895 [Patescibacteria group bacterium]|nr:hypothetical protein [Patescibacteria group bacterium]
MWDIVGFKKNVGKNTNRPGVKFLESVIGWWNRWVLVVIGCLDKWWSRGDLIPLSVYAVLVIVLTWPLVFQMGSHVPGLGNDSGDGFLFLWDMWWVNKQVMSGGDVFFTDYLFYPNGVNLAYHTLMFGQSMLSILFLKIWSLPVVFNLFYLLSMWLGAVFAYWLAKIVWRGGSGAFVAGLIFGFMPYIFVHSLGHFNLTMIWPIAALAFCSYKIILEKSNWWLLGGGLSLAYILLNDYQYFVFAVIFLVLFLLYFVLVVATKWRKKIITILKFFIVSLVAMVVAMPVVLRTVEVAKVYLPTALLSEVVYWSADLFSFVVPHFLHPYLGAIGQDYASRFSFSGIESYLFMGFSVLFIFLISFLFTFDKKDRVQFLFWWVVAIVFWVLSLGPLLKVGGVTDFRLNDVDYNVSLPYMLMYKLPFFSVARVPARFAVVMMLAVSQVVAGVVTYLMRGWGKVAGNFGRSSSLLILIFVSLLIVFEYATWPMKLQEVKVPLVYEEIKNDNDDFVILELPLWWASGHRSDGQPITILQYYQTYHEKKLLNGSVSRVPQSLFDYYYKLPGVKYLVEANGVVADEDDLDRQEVLNVFKKELDVKYIVLHEKYYSADDYYRIRSYLENVLGLNVWRKGDGEIVYMVI